MVSEGWLRKSSKLKFQWLSYLIKTCERQLRIEGSPADADTLVPNVSYYNTGLHSAHTTGNSIKTTNQQCKFNQPPFGYHSKIPVQSIGPVPAD
eukprot:scaffold254336_cov74-Attheya_sp.AAC.1